MKMSLLRELTLYRYRYYIGYGLFIVFVLAFLFVDIARIPNGVSESEMRSAVASNSIDFENLKVSDVVNLPYHLLQKASIGFFGLSPLSIRLPSLVIALLSAAALAVTLHQWFRKNIAVLSLLIATTSVPFISMGRTGTGSVLYMLLLLIILMSAVSLTTKTRGMFFWKLLVLVSGLLLLYIPLGIYAVIALVIAGLLHPHVRYQLKRTKAWQYLVLFGISGVLLAPLILAGLYDWKTIEILLGIDTLQDQLSIAGIGTLALSALKALFLFNKPEFTETITPFLNLTMMLLIGIGLVRTVIDRHAARSYLMLIWLSISIPLLVLNPTQLALLFVPCIILLAIGLEYLLREWYGVFPRNPYARIGAFIPLSLIIIGLLTISTTRYFYAYFYTDTSKYYHPELQAVRKVLKPHVTTTLIVPDEHAAFYDILRKQNRLLRVTGESTAESVTGERIILASTSIEAPGTPNKIITSPYKTDGVLLRTYSSTQQ